MHRLHLSIPEFYEELKESEGERDREKESEMEMEWNGMKRTQITFAKAMLLQHWKSLFLKFFFRLCACMTSKNLSLNNRR